MDSTKSPRQYMDIVGGKRPRRVAPIAESLPKEEPVLRQPQPRRMVSDFVRPAKAKRPIKKSAPTIDLPSKIVKETTFAAVDTDDTGVTSVEFGVIEESTKIEPDTSSDYLHVTPPEPAPEEKSEKEEKKSIFHKEPRKSPEPMSYPFLSSVSVPKRPLSASRPTGNYAGPRRTAAVTKAAAAPAPEPKRPRKKSSMPFVVIIILSVLLGVTLGALVYFVLPH